MSYKRESKTTDDLKREIVSSASIDEFLGENEDSFNSAEVKDLLGELVARKGITKAELARRSGMHEIYLYQIFSGSRKPSRNKLLSLAFGLELSFDETQHLLVQSGYAELYPKDKRDAVIIFGLTHGQTLQEVNDYLFDKNMETLI